MSALSRRTFLAASGTLTAALASRIASGQSTASASITAGEVISRIKQHVGVPWMDKTVDNLLTGSPGTKVLGIATTMMATLDVVQRCVAAGKNMIVTHETPFYLHQDQTADIADDPTLRFKLDYCQKHDVAIFHFHDHWHRRHPDGIAEGMVEQLGWQQFVNDPADPKKLTFPPTTLAAFARQMQTQLSATTLRVVGDPKLIVRTVQTSWGYIGREDGIKIIEQPGTDVLICGETREWELVEYVQDSIQAGNKKALIIVGHVLSEQGGMILCANWLKTFINEVPIQFIAAPEPFWNPANPPRS
jgi:putative NIF3 family GTP cyclohydrolase 1 type 2